MISKNKQMKKSYFSCHFVWRIFFFLKSIVFSEVSSPQFSVLLVDGDGIFTKSPSGSFPLFNFSGNHNRLYFGYYNSKNEIIIRYWDERLRTFCKPVVLWRDWGKSSSGMLLGDDHANPSIIVLRHQKKHNAEMNGRLLVASAEHGWRLETRRSAFEEAIEKWEPPVGVLERGATYSRLVELVDGRILLFARISNSGSNSRATFYFWESFDAGSSWDGPSLLVDSDEGSDDAIYIDVAPNFSSDSLHFIFNFVKYNNPIKGIHRYVNIYYVRYDVLSDTWLKANGHETSLPLYPATMDLVYETAESDWTYLSDIKVDSKNRPYILSCNDVSWQKNPSVLLQEHYLNDGVWVTDVISVNDRFIYSGESSYQGPWYANMASYDGNCFSTLYTSVRNEDGIGQLEVWMKTDREWTKSKAVTKDLHRNNSRPFSVRNKNGSIVVLWNFITMYDGSPFTEWKSEIRGLKIHNER